MNLKMFNFSLRQLLPLAPVLFGVVFSLAAYLQALDFPFVSDDEPYITWNAKLASLQFPDLWRVFIEPYNPYEFLPLRDISYWFDITFFGLNPSAFRVHNIILYLLCLPLVYFVTLGVWKYFRTKDAASAPWAAAAVTALFSVHPAHVEAVVWATGRKDVLSGIFSMLALWLAVSARRGEGRLFVPYAAAAMIAFVAVMLSKASYIAVAPVIALLWLLFWHDIPAKDRKYSLLLWPLAILSLAVLLLVAFSANSTVKIPSNSGIEAVTKPLAILGRLANIAFTPSSRHFYYPVTEQPYFPFMLTLGLVAFASAIFGMVVVLRKRSIEGFALAVFFLLCLPYLQIIPFRTFALVQDRYVALAVWPVVLLVVAILWRLKPALRIALFILVAIPWCIQTLERPRDWHSFEALIDADLRDYPEYYVPAVRKIVHFQLLQGYDQAAEKLANDISDPEMKNFMVQLSRASNARVNAIETGDPGEAMAQLMKLGGMLTRHPVQLMTDTPRQYTQVLVGKVFLFQWDDLSRHFPDDVAVHYNAGLSLLDISEYQHAAEHFRLAINTQRLPENVRGVAFKNLGLALLLSGSVAEAEAPLRSSLQQSPPDFRAFCLLSDVYKRTGRSMEADSWSAKCQEQIEKAR